MNELITLADINGNTPEERAAMLAPTYLMCEQSAADLRAQEQAIAAQRKQAEDLKEQIREYLRDNMEERGITELSAPGIVIKLTRGSEAVQIDDESLIPDNYWRIERAPEKALIKRAIKDGYDVAGARVVAGKSLLTIKILE